MKVRIKKTGQILNVEYDDDDLYKGWDDGAVWFYANEFDIIDEEETETQPLFALTAEEVEHVRKELEYSSRYLTTVIDASKTIGENVTSKEDRLLIINNLLTRIKQWQDGNK